MAISETTTFFSDQARADSIPGLEIEVDDALHPRKHFRQSGRGTDLLCTKSRFYKERSGADDRYRVFQQIFDRITIPSVRDALGQSIARQVREYR